MVGGEIVGIVISNNKVLVRVADRRSWKPETLIGSQTCCVRAKYNGEPLKLGDSFWWQCGKCYWTPGENRKKTCNHQHHYSCAKAGVDYDIQLEKIGYSHDGGNYEGPEDWVR